MASAEDAAARGPACQVEGCTNTLLNLRDYHLRYVAVAQRTAWHGLVSSCA